MVGQYTSHKVRIHSSLFYHPIIFIQSSLSLPIQRINQILHHTNLQMITTLVLTLIAYGYDDGVPEDTLITLVMHVSIFIFTVTVTMIILL